MKGSLLCNSETRLCVRALCSTYGAAAAAVFTILDLLYPVVMTGGAAQSTSSLNGFNQVSSHIFFFSTVYLFTPQGVLIINPVCAGVMKCKIHDNIFLLFFFFLARARRVTTRARPSPPWCRSRTTGWICSTDR